MLYDIPGTNLKAVSLNEFPPEAWITWGSTESSNDDSATFARKVGVVYRCVQIRSDAMRRIPWRLLRGETVVYENDTTTTPRDMPWLTTLGDMFALIESALCIESKAFLFLERNRVRMTALKWLAPSTMTPLWDEMAGLVGFERTINGRKRTYKTDEVLYLWRPDSLHETQPAVSPVAAALASAGVLYNLDKFSSSYFERGAIKATLLTVEGMIAPEEADRLKSWWKRIFSGIDKAWQTEVVRSKMVPIQIGEGVAELNNAELTREKRADVATTMGVPQSLLFADAANYATSQQDELNFWNLTIVPDSRLIAMAFNRQVFEPMGLRLEFRPQELDAYQEDENSRASSFKTYVDAGLKPSLVAEMLGLELPAGYDYADLDPEPEPQSIVLQQPAAQVASPEGEDEEDEGEEERAAAKAEADRFRRWLRKDARRIWHTERFTSDLLDGETKRRITAEVLRQEDGAAGDAPFRSSNGNGWEGYP